MAGAVLFVPTVKAYRLAVEAFALCSTEIRPERTRSLGEARPEQMPFRLRKKGFANGHS